MKTFSKMMNELLKSYEQHYQFQLRLTIDGQSVFCGFKETAASELAFDRDEEHVLLECTQKDAKRTLESIKIALMPFLVSVSENELFELALYSKADEHELGLLKNKMAENQYVLVMMSGTKELDAVKEIFSQLIEHELPMIMKQNNLLVLMDIDAKSDWIRKLEAIRSTMETELFVSIRMSISSVFEDLNEIKDYFEEVKQVQYLIEKYDPACLMAVPSSTWMLEMIDSLSEKKSQKMMNSLIHGDLKQLEDELILTAVSFMENNLSISATARALYVHRNTLIYRLDKILQLTGLDIRIFEDALKFRLAMTLMKK